MLCRHCGRTPSARPRGLCRACYRDRQLRERYPSTSKFGRRSTPDFLGRAVLAGTPTLAMPGTPEKVAILEQRAAHRQALRHPLDARRRMD